MRPIPPYANRQARRATWTPALMSGLILWLRSDMGITPSGGKAPAWLDQSGNGNDWAQGTPADQLVYTASDANFNGHPSLTGSATAAGFARANFAQGLSVVSLAVFYRMTANTAVAIMIGDGGGAVMMNANVTGLFDVNRINSGVNQRRLSGAALNTKYSRFAAIPCATAATDDPTLYTNGVAGGTVTSSTATNASIAAGTWRIGYHMEGAIAEVVALDRLVTAPEAAQFEAYARARYG